MSTLISDDITDVLWLHIRGAGGWTNKLYEYFEREQIEKCDNALVPSNQSVGANMSPHQTRFQVHTQDTREEQQTRTINIKY